MLNFEPHDSQVTDCSLINQVRQGSAAAYDTLYLRHLSVAKIVARRATRCQADADDVISEAFTKILSLLQRDAGPADEFRPYLCRVIRNLANDGYRREQRVETSDEIDPVDDEPGVDSIVDDVDREAARRALDSLPTSWQQILWDMEVLEIHPRDLAERRESTPHNVSALAHRAREALRSAFLSEIIGAPRESCEPVASRLGAYIRGTTRPRENTRIELHLDQCARCEGSLTTIRDVNSSFRCRAVTTSARLAS